MEKMVKSLEFYSKLQQAGFIYNFFFFFRFGQVLFNFAYTFAVHHKKSFVPVFLRSLLITYLIILSLEKEITGLEKSGNSLEFWLPKSVRTLFST